MDTENFNSQDTLKNEKNNECPSSQQDDYSLNKKQDDSYEFLYW